MPKSTASDGSPSHCSDAQLTEFRTRLSPRYVVNFCACLLVVFAFDRFAFAQLPPVGGHKINEVGLTGPTYELIQSGGVSRETYLAGLNEVGHIIGKTTRYPGSGNSWGTDAWFFDGTSTQLIGLTGNAYQYNASGIIKRSSLAASLNETDQVIGVTARFSAAGADMGQDVWLIDSSGTKILGLFGSGYQYATAGGTYRSSATNRLNNAGKAVGNTSRFTSFGASLGADTWLFDGQITQLISLTGAEYEYAATGGTRRGSNANLLNQAGHVSGSASRYSSSGVDLGGDAWLFSGTTTNVIGLAGPEYEYAASGGIYRSNFPMKLNDMGYVTGTANRYDAVGQQLGNDAWLYRGAVTQRIGLANGEYLAAGGTARSEPKAINNAGFVVGESQRYQYNPSFGWDNAGQDAWLFNGDMTGLIGLTDSAHQHVGEYGTTRYSSSGLLNNNSQAAGISIRYSTSGAQLGQDAWLANGLTTLPIGLTGNGYEYADNGGTFRYSAVRSLNEMGQAIGYTIRRSASGDPLGQAGWFYNLETGITSPLEFSTSTNGVSYTLPRILSDTGVVLGEYTLFDGTLAENRLFWWSAEAGFRDLGGLVAGGLSAAGWEQLVNVSNGRVAGGSTLFLYGNGLRTGQAAPGHPGFGVGYSAYLLTALATMPGDYDGNNVVDAADYVVWRKTLNSKSNLAADGNYNGIVDNADYVIWRNQFGAGQSTTNQLGASVPEPGTLSLLLAIISICALRRSRLRLAPGTPSQG